MGASAGQHDNAMTETLKNAHLQNGKHRMKRRFLTWLQVAWSAPGSPKGGDPRAWHNAMRSVACAVLVSALGALTFGASGLAEDRKAVAPKPALSVTTAQPQLGRLPIKLTANGTITAWQEASIGTEANGLRLTEVRANVGDVVRAGQVLATFAPESIQADLAQARANLLEAEANAADAAGNAGRARSLQSSGALSTQQINQYQTSEQTAKARVEAAKAMLAVQQIRLKHTQVLAPDSGVISARAATVGAVLPSGTELFRLIRKGRLEWRAEVTSAELGRLSAGTTAIVTAASGVQLKGRVRMIAPTVDPQTRAGLVYVDLPPMQMSQRGAGQFSAGPPQGKSDTTGGSAVREATSVGVMPGMFAKGEFALGDSSSLLVPQTAVVVRDGFSYVYRLGPDNRVAQVKVQTGRLSGERIEITSALAFDVRLVASGAGFLNDGDLVRVIEDGKAVPAPGAPAAKPGASAAS